MAKKKPMFGVNNYHKRTPKKRPGVHTKNRNKRKPPTKKDTEDRGGNETRYDHPDVSYIWGRHTIRQI